MTNKDQIALAKLYVESYQNSNISNMAYEILRNLVQYSTDKYPHSQDVFKQANPELVNSSNDEDSYHYVLKMNIPYDVLDWNPSNMEESLDNLSEELRHYSGAGREYRRGFVSDVEPVSDEVGRFTIEISGGLDI